MKSWARPLIGWAALVLGIGGVVASLAVTSTRAGEGLTFGFAAFIAFFGLLSLLVRNPTPDHWGLFVSGFVLFLLPWLGAGFAPDPGAAWTGMGGGVCRDGPRRYRMAKRQAADRIRHQREHQQPDEAQRGGPLDQ